MSYELRANKPSLGFTLMRINYMTFYSLTVCQNSDSYEARSINTYPSSRQLVYQEALHPQYRSSTPPRPSCMHHVAYRLVRRPLLYCGGSISYISRQMCDSIVYEFDSLTPSFIWLLWTPCSSVLRRRPLHFPPPNVPRNPGYLRPIPLLDVALDALLDKPTSTPPLYKTEKQKGKPCKFQPRNSLPRGYWS